MAAPTAPDLTSITTEGLKKAGYTTPTSAQLTRAQTYWMREIKNDLHQALADLTLLQSVAFMLTVIGKHLYANPTGYSSVLSLNLLDGSHTGTAQTGAANSVTLAASESATSDYAIGKYILITAGTGAGSCSQITGYSATTKIATVTPNFTTTPVASDTYMIVETYYPLEEDLIYDIDTITYPTNKQRPTHFFMSGNKTSGEFILYPNPDKVYGIQMRYNLDFMTLDLADARMTTAYQRWESFFIYGIFMKALEDDDDNRFQLAVKEYQGKLADLVFREKYGKDSSTLTMRVVEL